MPMFSYKGRNTRGDLMQGNIESPNAQAVAVWMTAVGITPVAIQQKGGGEIAKPQWMKAFEQVKLDEMDLLLFTRQMGALVRAGVPLMQALTGIQKATDKQHIVVMLQAIRDDLDRGTELSVALAKHPKSFNEFYVSMVKVGESSGRLEGIFSRLHEQIEFDMDMKRKMKGALRYPMFVGIALAIAVTIINVFVVPTFASVYVGMKLDLPLPTRMLIAASSFTIKYWWLVLAMIAGAVTAFRFWLATTPGRLKYDAWKLRVPIFGPIQKKTAMARYSFSFATAVQSGIPLVDAYTLTSKVVSNAYYERAILRMREGVERGEGIYRVAQSSGIFNALELQMISVGEETGKMDEMLRSISEMYREEVDFEVSRLAQTLEPLLIAGLGIMVAGIMLAVFLPMWDLTQLTRKK